MFSGSNSNISYDLLSIYFVLVEKGLRNLGTVQSGRCDHCKNVCHHIGWLYDHRD